MSSDFKKITDNKSPISITYIQTQSPWTTNPQSALHTYRHNHHGQQITNQHYIHTDTITMDNKSPISITYIQTQSPWTTNPQSALHTYRHNHHGQQITNQHHIHTDTVTVHGQQIPNQHYIHTDTVTMDEKVGSTGGCVHVAIKEWK